MSRDANEYSFSVLLPVSRVSGGDSGIATFFKHSLKGCLIRGRTRETFNRFEQSYIMEVSSSISIGTYSIEVTVSFLQVDTMNYENFDCTPIAKQMYLGKLTATWIFLKPLAAMCIPWSHHVQISSFVA